MKKILPLLILLLQIHASATTYRVGSSSAYESPHALYIANVVQDNDTIEIDAGTYTGEATLAAWQRNNLLIKGVDGKPHLVADGENMMGKGIWVLRGDNITVENVEFEGATVPDQNGAGIRLDGSGLTVKSCYFHDNENGILTSNPYEGDILIEYSEFANNGYGNGYSHNLYIGHVNKLTFRFNYTHHAVVGHNLKSRAGENLILYNRIMDEQTGNSSRLVDLPNGGFSIVMGNILMQGNNAQNNNMVGYGKEGLSNAGPHQFYFINNTLVNKRNASCLFLDIDDETGLVNISNNIFAGSDHVADNFSSALSNNVVAGDISTVDFLDEGNYNYRVGANSPAIDNGTLLSPVNGYSLIPEKSYAHPLNYFERSTVGIIDAGAFEYGSQLAIPAHPSSKKPHIAIWPNPTQGILNIDAVASTPYRTTIYNSVGKAISTSHSRQMNLSDLPMGVYFLDVVFKSGRHTVKRIVKE